MSIRNLGARIGKSFTSRGVVTKQNTLKSQDIKAWVRAINSARNKQNPNRTALLNLYENILIDGHLDAVTDKRMKAISNKRMMFIDGNKMEHESMNENVVHTPWFYELTKAFSERPVWGTTIVELMLTQGVITDVEKIDRKLIIPEQGKLLFDEGDRENFIYYKEDPAYSQTLFSFGGTELGKLYKAAMYVIYKRGGFGDWAQFAELFGMPFRIGKYEGWDTEGRKQLINSLEEMGSAAYAAIPRQTDIEFKDANQAGKSEVFKHLIEMCNSEISKIFLGQTMTTDNGSSRSQSEVHKEVEQEIILADMIEYEYYLNWEFKEKLIKLGVNEASQGKFTFDTTESLPKEKLIEIAMKVSKRVPIAPEWWYETFEIEPPKEGSNSDKKPKPEEDEEEDQEDEPNNGFDPRSEFVPGILSVDMNYSPSTEEQQLIDDLYNDNLSDYSPALIGSWIERLGGAIRSNLSVSKGYNEPDHMSGLMMEMNMHRFGWNKSLALIYDLNQALDISESFSDFRKKAVNIMGKFDAYLETEYNQAISVSQNARRWNDLKANEDVFTHWQYTTAGDSNVRSSHAALDGMVFAVSDKEAGNFFAPNGYGCRCSARKLTTAQAKKIGISSGKDAVASAGDEEVKRMKKGGFFKNKGERNEIWDTNKTYISELPDNEVVDISKINYASAGLDTSSKIRAKRSAKLKTTDQTPEQILTWFDDNAKEFKGAKRVLLTDYSGRKMGVSRKALETKLKGKYISEKEARDKIWNNVSGIVANPDEVFFAEHKKGKFQYRFVKHYQDESMVVIAEVSSTGLDLQDWSKAATGDNYRNGVLVKY